MLKGGFMSILEVKNVTKTYKGRRGGASLTAVDDFSFTVDGGEIVGFVGPNGAGKSTMLKMITGLAIPTSGQITINGHDVITDRVEALGVVGTIVENPDMYLEWTGEENLKYLYGLQTGRFSKGERDGRIESVLKLVGLYDRRKDAVRKYSLGMKQRLGIAQALLSKPSLLVLDEPTNGLDPEGIKEIRDVLIHLARSYNMAILVSSHLLSEMQMMCDRFIIIDKGKKASDMTADEVGASAGPVWQLVTENTALAIGVLKDKFDIIAKVEGEKVEFSSSVPSGDIMKELILSGVNVRELTQKKNSLEDVFIRSTHKRQGGMEEVFPDLMKKEEE